MQQPYPRLGLVNGSSRAWQTIALAAVSMAVSAGMASAQPVDVTVARLSDGRECLMRAGQPYFIKGAGGNGSRALLKSCGANSFRTWGAETLGADLDEAQKNGLTVAAGIWLGHAEQGFDYHNPEMIAQQRDHVREIVLKYRDHPALLVWSLGNEMEGEGDDPAIWKAVNDLAKMVKQLDPHHPVMTVIHEFVDKKVRALNTYCPDVDIVGLNTYASASTVGPRYVAAGGTKPYVVTEFGPPGQWEQGKTPWGASLEMPSTAKADWYRKAYLGSVKDKPLCLGSYAFLWGTKQEATATWYGMLLPDGSQTAAVDTMRALWTDTPETQQAPAIKSLTLDGPDTVAPGTMLHVALKAADPHGQPFKSEWTVTADREASNNGGQEDAPLDAYPAAVVNSSADGATVKAPAPGAYRLFVTLRNAKNRVAVANVPFLVTDASAGASNDSASFQLTSAATGAPAHLPYVIYGKGAGATPTYIPSGYMGNAGAVTMDPNCTTVRGPMGGPCLQASYAAPDNWGGVVWQSPANDWGDKPGGLNLTGAKTLSFWARGAKGGEVVSFQYGLLGSDKHYHDTSGAKLADVTLTPTWTKYAISVAGKNLSDIKTGFSWVVAGSGKPVTFYLDGIRYQ